MQNQTGRTTWVALCCMSALLFGLLGVLGVNILRRGTTSEAMIAWRFWFAAAALVGIVVATRRPWGRGRQVWQPLFMGAVLYAAESFLYFATVQRLSAGLAALLLYTTPVLVVVVGVVRRTQLLTVRIVTALVLAVGGVGCTLLGPGVPFSTVGIATGIGSAVAFTAYYFGMDTLPAGTDRLVATTLVCTGAGVSMTLLALARGTFQLLAPDAVPWVLAMALLSTVVAITLLMLGIQAAGPSTASVVSCLEPITAVVLGATFLGEAFGPPQWLGTAAVVAAIVLLSAPARRAADDSLAP